MTAAVKLLGIVNITEDSFSDGGRFLAPDAAIEHARTLARNGADILDLGAAASNPDAKPVSAETQIARLAPVVTALRGDGMVISIDSDSPVVQRWALTQGVECLNDTQGFSHPEFYPELAAGSAKLIVMHSVQHAQRASRVSVSAKDVFDLILRFFEERLGSLALAGIRQQRFILDPGMGFFLGSNPDASVTVLRGLKKLKVAFGLPLLVSVSRKSFLRTIAGTDAAGAGAATLAAELFAVRMGADYIRTHDPRALRQALAVASLLDVSRSPE